MTSLDYYINENLRLLLVHLLGYKLHDIMTQKNKKYFCPLIFYNYNSVRFMRYILVCIT